MWAGRTKHDETARSEAFYLGKGLIDAQTLIQKLSHKPSGRYKAETFA